MSKMIHVAVSSVVACECDISGTGVILIQIYLLSHLLYMNLSLFLHIPYTGLFCPGMLGTAAYHTHHKTNLVHLILKSVFCVALDVNKKAVLPQTGFYCG